MVKLFTCVLPYSRESFVTVLPNGKRSTLIFGMQKAFEYFGGVPRVIIHFDGTDHVVSESNIKKAITNDAFQKFFKHYGIENILAKCSWTIEKGIIGNLCKKVRSLLRDIQPVSCFREVQDYLDLKLANYRGDLVIEKSMADREMLKPLPKRRFMEGENKDIIVSDLLTFTYDTSEYPVPVDNPGITIGIKVTPYDITCFDNGKILCVHPRSSSKHNFVPVFDHYLKIYEQRRRSVKNSMALEAGILPAELAEFRSKCEEKDVDKQLVKIMLLSREHDLKIVKEAVNKANTYWNPTYNLVCSIISIINFIKLNSNMLDAKDEFEWANNEAYDFKIDPLSIYDDIVKDEGD
jgi:hypothetical protein